MLRAIIKFGRNLLAAILFAAMIMSMQPKDTAYADYSENETRKVDVVIRAGEWGNQDTVKPGKRYTWGKDINLSQHGISISEIPKDIPLRCENNEWFISEFDINLKLARAIAKKLDQYGVDVNLQYATNKSGLSPTPPLLSYVKYITLFSALQYLFKYFFEFFFILQYLFKYFFDFFFISRHLEDFFSFLPQSSSKIQIKNTYYYKNIFTISKSCVILIYDGQTLLIRKKENLCTQL